MVEDSITDPTRVAQLLASELTGLETGVLADVTVADADEDAEPAPDGSVAYAIEYDSQRVGTVRLFPDSAVLELSVDVGAVPDTALPSERVADGTHLSVESGVAVKQAVDALRRTLDALA